MTTKITISNPAGTRAVDPAMTATHARSGHRPGDVYDPRVALARRDLGEKAPWIFGGEEHDLRRYATGSLVLVPDEEHVEVTAAAGTIRCVPTMARWTCYVVVDNPVHEPSGPGYSVPVVSIDEFHVRRHGQE